MLDIIFSVLLLLLLSLPMAVIAIAVILTSDGGALFFQKRVGRNGRVFTCLKFRTMYKDAPREMPKSEFADAERYITPVGRFLRHSSLDELPQLFNVLIGDMSLVGPRPLIMGEGEIHELRRNGGVYKMRPGITGLAQINGRDRLSDTEKARLDIIYTKNANFSEDARILYRTLKQISTGA